MENTHAFGDYRPERRYGAYLRLSKEEKLSSPAQTKPPKSLPLSSIEAEPQVFQHREDIPETRWGLETHIEGLVQAIKREPSHHLDPVIVWFCGGRWIVIDGHFRLEAYSKFAYEKDISPSAFKIPCRVFTGSLSEAWDHSVTANKKVVEPLTSTERSNAAWQKVCRSFSPEGWTSSKNDLVKLGLVTINTVSRMRRTLGELIEAGETTLEEAHELPWLNAMALNQKARNDGDVPAYDDENMERQARVWADQLRRTFATYPALMPLTFFHALEIYSPKMIEVITEYLVWTDEDENNPEDF
jgi:hypothetical protein